MSGKLIRVGPVAMSATLTTNIYNNTASTLYDVIRHVTIVNKTAAPVAFSLWLGATGANVAGTEVIGSGRYVPAKSGFEWYGAMKMASTDFLVGGASAATSLTITIETEQFVV